MDKMPKHVEMAGQNANQKVGTDKMPTTEKRPDKMPTFGWHLVRLAFCPTTPQNGKTSSKLWSPAVLKQIPIFLEGLCVHSDKQIISRKEIYIIADCRYEKL